MSPTPPPTHRPPFRRARRHQRGRTSALHRPLSRLAAAILLVLVIAGPPALLLALTGNPLDPPNALRSTDALTQQLDDQTVVYLLAVAAWLCWLHLLSCLTTETLHQLRGLRIRTPSPGLFRGNALLASHLVAAVLLSGSHSTLTPAPQAQTTLLAATIDPTHLRTPGIATPAVTDRPQAPAVDRVAPQASPRQDARTTAAVTTARGSDGTHEAILCRVLPPQGRHHDTLWDIAERHLGDGMRWRDIYALNEGRLMPDGHRLTRASLIRPGWILQLPGDATALAIDQVLDEPPTDNPPTKSAEQHQPPAVNATPAVEAPPAAAPAAAPRQGEEPSATSRHDDPQAAPEREPSHREVPPREEMTPASPALTSSPSSSAVTSAPSEPSATSDTPSSDTSRIEIAAGLGTLLLGAAALLRSLTRRRKLAARRRPPGVRHTRPAPELLNAERQLRRDARVAEDIAATLRLALLVAATESSGGVAAPQVKAVWEHPDGSLELVLHDHLSDLGGRASAPAPFETTARGWRLTPEGQRYLFAVRLNGVRRQDRTARLDQQLQASPDPFPLLIPIGSQDGSACLVNLEPLGLISIDTDAGVTAQTDPDRPDHRQLIVAAWAQTLAGAPWAELTELYVPRTWVQLITGLSRAHTHDFTLHTSEGLLASGSSADATSLDLTRGPQPLPAQQRERYASSMTLEAARRTGTGGADAHRLTLSLGYPSGQLPTWLVHAALDPLDPNLALVIGPHPQAHRWTLAHDGTLAIPGIADRLIPLQLSPDEHGLLLRLLEHAEDPPHAAPDDPDRADLLAQCLPADSEARSAEGDDPNSEQSPSAGLEDELTGAADNDPRAGTGDIPDAVIDLTSYPASPGTSCEPERPGAAEGRPPTSAAAPRLTPDDEATRAAEPIEEHIAEHIAKAAEAADELAHEEVAAEVGSAPVVPAVLPPGPVEVCVLGPLEVHGSTGAPPRKQALDVLVHLALHRRPVPAEVLFEAVWPNSGYNSRTLRNRVSEVRGYIAPGVDHVRGGYLLPDLVQTDWQRFQSLARGDTDAQLAALQLVRGRPFDGSTLEWMHLEGHFAEMEAAIVDLALEVGERALRDKQYETARTACYAGLRGCPYDERIYRVGMEAAAALGATAEVRELRRRLDLILEEEVDDDIQPATEALYRRLQNEDELRARRHQRHA